jgi:hypothetical protein
LPRSATDVHDDVGVTPFRQLLQENGFARPEPAGHTRGAAARHGKQQIKRTLAGAQHLDL